MFEGSYCFIYYHVSTCMEGGEVFGGHTALLANHLRE